MVLRSEAGITKIAVSVSPITDTSVVVQAQFIGNDKRHLGILQTLPEKKHTPHTTVTVLEWMDTLKPHVEAQYVIEGHLLECVIVG